MKQETNNHPTQFDRNRAWQIVDLIDELESSEGWVKKSRQGKAFAISDLLYKFRKEDMTSGDDNSIEDFEEFGKFEPATKEVFLKSDNDPDDPFK